MSTVHVADSFLLIAFGSSQFMQHRKVCFKNVLLAKQSYRISRTTKMCLWRKCLELIWERTIRSECFSLVQWQGDLHMNKYSNFFLIAERTSLIMVAPYILPSAEVVERTHAGLSFCWHVEKPKCLKLFDISPCLESEQREYSVEHPSLCFPLKIRRLLTFWI